MREELKEWHLRGDQGPSLVELLDRYDLTPSELAARSGVSTLVVNGILDGTADLTEDLARRFASVLALAPETEEEPSFRIGIETIGPR